MSQTHEAVTFQHPSIGALRGIRRLPQVDQFLGVQYARLADRFSRGALVDSYSSPVDATAQGPLPVANPENCDVEHILLQHALPHPDYTFSDTECLNLNVSVPKGTAGGPPLPVIVFVHGGGFQTGSASWPQWDLAPLVEQSVKAGSPIVAVGVNYRLGHFGFMTSPALREAGYRPNNGLDDQKLGFRWVQKYIGGFGGDPDNVTFFGSSIGAASGFTHLQSDEKLFDRLVALGGSPLIQPLPLAVADFVAGAVTKTLGFDSLSPAEQVKALLKIPAAELEAKLRNVPLPINSVLDNDIVHHTATFDSLSKPEALEATYPGIRWAKTIFIGEGQLDGMVFALTALQGRQDDLAAALKAALKTALADEAGVLAGVLAHYGLDGTTTLDASAGQLAVLRFGSDIGFARGAAATARAWAAGGQRHGIKAFLSHFYAPNPWPGGWQGYGTHALDAAFVLQNYSSYLSAGQQACGERMARDVVSFAYGRAPFEPLSADGTGPEMLYEAEADGEVDKSRLLSAAEATKVTNRGELEALAGGSAALYDKLLGALGTVLKGPQ